MSYPQVVRVFATTQEPDYDCPWQARTPSSGTGSGVVIGRQQILTGAHVVANATFLQVQKISDPGKAVAQVEAVCHDSDLALLTVSDERFLSDIRPAEVGELPNLRDKVAVVGYPVGGEEISITEGVVSRIEVTRYDHSQRSLLAVTVDAAINQGNSGGPVFKGGKIAGIAFQKLSGAENIGEMVPAPIIRRFLEGISAGRAAEVPGLGISTQSLENPLLRRSIGAGPDDSGVLVTTIEHGSSAWGVLEPRDALMELGGMRIANNGTVQYRQRYRTRYDVVLGDHYVGDELDAVVLRRGQRVPVRMTLQPMRHLVPRSQYDTHPSYFVYGGCVFQPLTRDYLATWDKWWNKAPKEFLYYYYMGVRTEARRQVVVLSQVLADEINVGYSHLYNEGIAAVNGVMPRDMADFVARVEQCRDVVELTTTSDGVIVLDADAVRDASARILDRYHIVRDRSDDLLRT
jgi:S1-C subfamily serine protease